MEGKEEKREGFPVKRFGFAPSPAGLAAAAIITVCFSVFGFAKAANAATMYLAPSERSLKVGDAFSVGVYVSSPDQAMNAASGVINVPTDKFEIVSLSKGGSIINLWVQEPSFSIGAGTAHFEGVVLNPGYTGSAGNVITLNLKAKAAGTAVISFSSAAVLANDGLGTNLLKGLGSGTYSISEKAAAPPAEEREEPKPEPREEEEGARAGVPVISSQTHPDEDAWYADGDARFSWSVPRGVTAVRLLVSQDPDELPSMTHSPPVDSLELNDMEDGVWYVHARFRTAAGWGDSAHFRFQIDTRPPDSFDAVEVRREDLTQPAVQFTVRAEDRTSGIDRYEMRLDGAPPVEWLDDGSHAFTTPVMEPGKHSLTARVLDKAGNQAETSVIFYVEALAAPRFTDVPRELETGDVLILKGETDYPHAQVTVWIKRDELEPKAYSVATDADGKFVYVMDERVRTRSYKAWAVVTDERGAKSESSQVVTIMVRLRAFAEYLSWLVLPLFILVIVLSVLLWRERRVLAALKRRKEREERREDRAVQKKLSGLKRDVRKEFKEIGNRRVLKKKDLNEAETRLKKRIDEANALLGHLPGKGKRR
jgi:hypothetical protein